MSVGVLAMAAAMSRAEEPSAREILEAARFNQISTEARLKAQLRTGREKEPFEIVLSGGEVAYSFENPSETILLRFGEDRSELLVRRGEGEEALRSAEGGEPVRGGNLTYEDLALRFLYWPEVKLLGGEIFRGRFAWKLELHPMSKGSLYAAARIWIDKESGALLRVEGYDWNGRLVKRFEVLSVQRIGGQYFLKTMRVETLDPSTNPAKVIGRTYLDVLDAGAAGE